VPAAFGLTGHLRTVTVPAAFGLTGHLRTVTVPAAFGLTGHLRTVTVPAAFGLTGHLPSPVSDDAPSGSRATRTLPIRLPLTRSAVSCSESAITRSPGAGT
jgi:hypothetical protein